jgi:hypothetical protein
VFSVATKLALLLHRRRAVVLVVSVVAAVIGAKVGHPNNGHGQFGLWDGPL